jgi:hypothetical protein
MAQTQSVNSPPAPGPPATGINFSQAAAAHDRYSARTAFS